MTVASERSFIDSNVLIYGDARDQPTKQEQSVQLVTSLRARELGVVSTQVLQEYFSVTTRKLGTDAALAKRKVELLGTLDLVQVDLRLITEAIDLHRLEPLSFWDALIVRAAQRAHCQVLYSEDMQPGRRFGDIRVENPFNL